MLKLFNNHKKPNFQRVNYQNFRESLKLSAGTKVKSQGCKTIVYDQNNRMFAIIKSAALDTIGQSHAPEYYVRAA